MPRRTWWTALLLGTLAPAVGLGGVALSIASCPEFSWRQNALSDLGHAQLSPVAVTFNLSLATAGTALLAFSAGCGRRRFPLTSLILGFSAYLLILVATFDESYGGPHNASAVAFFLSLLAAAGAYSWERRSLLPAIAIPVSLAGWIAYTRLEAQWGIAVPEMVALIAWLAWYADMVRLVSLGGRKIPHQRSP